MPQSADRWPPDDDRMPWTGWHTGQAEAIAAGLYAKLVPGKGWVPCNKEEPGARPDLNTLFSVAKWDRSQKRWIIH